MSECSSLNNYHPNFLWCIQTLTHIEIRCDVNPIEESLASHRELESIPKWLYFVRAVQQTAIPGCPHSSWRVSAQTGKHPYRWTQGRTQVWWTYQGLLVCHLSIGLSSPGHKKNTALLWCVLPAPPSPSFQKLYFKWHRALYAEEQRHGI